VDVVVRGDGEDAVGEIASGKPLGEIAGISYRQEGKIVHNPVRSCEPSRDDLYPDRRLRKYSYALDQGGLRGPLFDTIASSRGCPFNCAFCSFTRNPWSGKRAWSARSPESVVREIEGIDAEIVFFVDDNFTHDADRVAAICDLLVARGVRKRYIANARVEIARRPDVLAKMQRAGFSMLLMGIESAKDATLKSMRKGFDTKRLRGYFNVLRRTRMMLLGYFIIGNIGEDEADMLEISRLARELGLDTVQLTLLRNERFGGLDELVAESPGYHIAPDGLIYSDTFSTARLRQIRHRIHQRFHTPGRTLHLIEKGLRNRILTPAMLLRLPWFLVQQTRAHFARKRARRRLRRIAAVASSGPAARQGPIVGQASVT
jgi:hypothetical protein